MEKIRIFMEEICRRIVNKPVKYIGRASSMLCLGLGEKKISNISYNEKLTEVYEYYIHVQCPGRSVDLSNKKIIVASGDIYEPRTDDVNIEKFDWEIENNNLFDIKSKQWIEGLNDLRIVDIKINFNSDLFIMFSNNNILETFTEWSNNSECWRIFKSRRDIKENSEHLIGDSNR